MNGENVEWRTQRIGEHSCWCSARHSPPSPRAELTDDETSMTAANDASGRRARARAGPRRRARGGALEAAGVEFIDENGEGPGVRLRKRLRTSD